MTLKCAEQNVDYKLQTLNTLIKQRDSKKRYNIL